MKSIFMATVSVVVGLAAIGTLHLFCWVCGVMPGEFGRWCFVFVGVMATIFSLMAKIESGV